MLSIEQKNKWLSEYRSLTKWEQAELLALLSKEGADSSTLIDNLRETIERCGFDPSDLLTQSELSEITSSGNSTEDVLDSMSDDEVKDALKDRCQFDIDDLQEFVENTTLYASKYNFEGLMDLHDKVGERIGEMLKQLVPESTLKGLERTISKKNIERLISLI